MKIQYWHYRDISDFHRNYTVAVIQPVRSELDALEKRLVSNEDPSITLEIGIAKMHPKEREWKKKAGREIAKSNIKPVKFELSFSRKEKGMTIYWLVSPKKDVEICLLLSAGKDNAFLKEYYKPLIMIF
jgi:hypothetical protein